jgi:opacity protein-like surface antigen
MLRIVTSIFIAMATLSISDLASAQDDYSRPGWYLGLGGTTAFLTGTEREVEAWLDQAGDLSIQIGESLGINARAGYRGNWAGGELRFEWMEGYDVDMINSLGDADDYEIDGWAVTLDGKLYPFDGVQDSLPELAKRFQPFLSGGIGYLTFSSTRPGQPAGADFREWDFALRAGGGVDVYLTKNVAISVDATYVYPVADDLDGLDYLSIGWGLLYRF